MQIKICTNTWTWLRLNLCWCTGFVVCSTKIFFGVLHASKNSSIGAILGRTLPTTSIRMSLFVKNFYSCFSSFIFLLWSHCLPGRHLWTVFIMGSFSRYCWAFVAGQHSLASKFDYSREFSFFPPSSFLLADTPGGQVSMRTSLPDP